MFTTLTLENFRGFEELRLEDLQRVNLIVGRNNAGKTSLLEGIVLLAQPEQMKQLPQILRAKEGNSEQRYYRWLVRDQGPDRASLKGDLYEVVLMRNGHSENYPKSEFVNIYSKPKLKAWAAQPPANFRLSIVSVQPRGPDEVVKLFSAAVSRRGGEKLMDELFHDLDDRISKVRVLPFDDGLHVMFDFDLSEMVPLSQVGQGVNRLITIYSELIAQDSDICIIDEIENGIHHSMLEQVWQGIASAAERLNTQVFATTHSQECIEAAHAAFASRPSYDLGIVQLFRVEGRPQGRVLNRKLIEAALAGEIDLR